MSKSNNKIGVVQLTILTIVNMMGSGIIMLPTQLAQVGTISILSWLVTAAGSTALAFAFAKCGMFSKKSGGMGGYAEYAFGRSGNFMANYTYAVSLLIANVAIAISAVGYADVLFGFHLTPIETCIATILVLWVATVANFGGARITGQVSSVTVWGIIIPVIGVSIIGWYWFDFELYRAAWNPHGLPFFQALGGSIAMTLWAFLGLESACANADAVENPEKNVPIAVMGGTLGAAVIYIISTNVIAGLYQTPIWLTRTHPLVWLLRRCLTQPWARLSWRVRLCLVPVHCLAGNLPLRKCLKPQPMKVSSLNCSLK